VRTLLLVLALLIPSQVLAASGPPPGLAGTLAIVAQDATSVTLHAEQTGGEPVTLSLEHTCYNADDTAWQNVTVKFSGAVDRIFNTGSFTFHGRTHSPADCHATLNFYYSSSRVVILAGVDTVP
jgi:hypothetical protein